MEERKMLALTLKSDSIDYLESAFASKIVGYFLKKKAEYEKADGYPKSERPKNIYLAKIFYRQVKFRNLDIDFVDESRKLELYKRVEDLEFWKEIIDFMFKYADPDTLKFYTQTIRGVFSFYFKHYNRIKSSMDARNLDSEIRLIQASVRKWTKQDSVAVFYLYLAKLYLHLKPPDSPLTFNTIYYSRVTYLEAALNVVPKIRPVVLENSMVLRGLLLQFSEQFRDWMVKWNVDINDVFDYEEFKELCNKRGVLLSSEVINRPLNDILYEALSMYVEGFQ
jgi:hypothetical protein